MTAAWYHSGVQRRCGGMWSGARRDRGETGAADRRQGANLLDRGQERRRVGGRVQGDDTDRPARIPAEREAGDVDPVLAENTAHATDDARLVVVLQHQDDALEWRLDVHPFEHRQARAARLEDRAFNPPLAFAGLQLDGQEIGEVARARALRLDDL